MRRSDPSPRVGRPRMSRLVVLRAWLTVSGRGLLLRGLSGLPQAGGRFYLQRNAAQFLSFMRQLHT